MKGIASFGSLHTSLVPLIDAIGHPIVLPLLSLARFPSECRVDSVLYGPEGSKSSRCRQTMPTTQSVQLSGSFCDPWSEFDLIRVTLRRVTDCKFRIKPRYLRVQLKPPVETQAKIWTRRTIEASLTKVKNVYQKVALVLRPAIGITALLNV